MPGATIPVGRAQRAQHGGLMGTALRPLRILRGCRITLTLIRTYVLLIPIAPVPDKAPGINEALHI